MIGRLRVGAQRVLVFAFVLSMLAHLFGAALFNALVRPRVMIAGDPVRVIVATTTLALEHRQKTRPQQGHRTPLPRTVAHPAAAAHSVTAAHSAPSRHRELAKIVAYAPPQPKQTHVTANDDSAQFAADQAKFARTLAHLRSQNDPIATQQRMATSGGGSGKRYAADFSTFADTSHGGDGYLEPVKSWNDGPYTYYYLRYDVVYPDGGRESGYVPWPVRYLAKDDPFAHNLPPYRVALPLPLPDFVPSSGDAMKPLIAFCYRHRTELISCPIVHD